MKRQVAIVGPTPEFLRWSIRRDCELRQDTEIDSVDQTEKRLRAIRAAGLAVAEGRVFEGIAVHRDTLSGAETPPKGFQMDEVLGPWGGQPRIEWLCEPCPANVLGRQSRHGPWAGCHGWLRRDELGPHFDQLLDDAWSELNLQVHSPRWLSTDPRWYGLWSAGSLEPAEIELVYQLFQSVARNQPNAVLNEFCQVARQCLDDRLTLDVELIPPGFSDGRRWTIAPHCAACRAPRETKQFRGAAEACPVCQTTGCGHPEVKRRVLGLRPYIELSVFMPRADVNEFVETCRERHSNFDQTRH